MPSDGWAGKSNRSALGYHAPTKEACSKCKHSTSITRRILTFETAEGDYPVQLEGTYAYSVVSLPLIRMMANSGSDRKTSIAPLCRACVIFADMYPVLGIRALQIVCTPNAKVCCKMAHAQLLQAMSLNRYSQSMQCRQAENQSVKGNWIDSSTETGCVCQKIQARLIGRLHSTRRMKIEQTIDALVAKVGATRDRLREFRSALITAAVTGRDRRIDLEQSRDVRTPSRPDRGGSKGA